MIWLYLAIITVPLLSLVALLDWSTRQDYTRATEAKLKEKNI